MPTDGHATALTPQQRLASSRRALLRQMQGHDDPPDPLPRGDGALARLDQNAWGLLAHRAVERWWRRHPVNAAGQVARPLLAHYARRNPGWVIGLAAAIGALLVLTRPWRLLSTTAVLAGLLKGSDLADLVTTALSHRPIAPGMVPAARRRR